MKIIRIKNKLMFNSNDPEGFHYYAFFWNKRYKKYNAIQLTHIAKKDDKRYKQVNNGLIKPIRLKKLDKYSDSGITKNNYVSDICGDRLDPKMGIVQINKVSEYSSNKIKSFATNLYSKGKKIGKKTKRKKNVVVL